MYSEGRGTPKDGLRALDWFRIAASHGSVLAQIDIADRYYDGLGLARSYKQAMYWLRKAADQGHPEAQRKIAILCANGQGVLKDIKESLKWYKLAAEQGLVSAQFRLGVLYSADDSVPINLPEAMKWLRRAADQNHSDASTLIAAIERSLRSSLATAETVKSPSMAQSGSRSPSHQASSRPTLNKRDLPKVLSVYRENEMRFKRDFAARDFVDDLPFMKSTETLFQRDVYSLSFGREASVECTVEAPGDISKMADWNKGDTVRVAGVIKDVIMGSVVLESCSLSK